MDQKFAVLSKGPNFASEGYNTLHQAREDGALVLAYGYVAHPVEMFVVICRDFLPPDRAFIETVMNFLGVSLTLYAAGHVYMFVFHNKIIKPTVRCPYCKQYISETVSGSICVEAHLG